MTMMALMNANLYYSLKICLERKVRIIYLHSSTTQEEGKSGKIRRRGIKRKNKVKRRLQK